LGDDNFFFQLGLNFFIKTCLFLHFKNTFKNINILFYFLDLAAEPDPYDIGSSSRPNAIDSQNKRY